MSAATETHYVVYTDLQMIRVLQRIAEDTSSTALSRISYDRLREAGDPSSALYEARFGCWNNAVSLAGLEPTAQDQQLVGTTTRWSAEELITALKQFINETARTACRAYESWRTHPSNQHLALPPAATIRYRLGSWSRAVSLASA